MLATASVTHTHTFITPPNICTLQLSSNTLLIPYNYIISTTFSFTCAFGTIHIALYRPIDQVSLKILHLLPGMRYFYSVSMQNVKYNVVRRDQIQGQKIPLQSRTCTTTGKYNGPH